MVINGSNGVTDADIGLQSILNQIKGDCRPGIFLRKVKETGPRLQGEQGVGGVHIQDLIGWKELSQIPDLL